MYVDRNSAYLRSQRIRAIRRKERIIKAKFRLTEDEYADNQQRVYVKGMLDKGKVHCSCKMCKYEKHNKIEKHNVKSKLDLMQNEIDEYV